MLKFSHPVQYQPWRYGVVDIGAEVPDGSYVMHQYKGAVWQPIYRRKPWVRDLDEEPIRQEKA